jgi:hypothetical protein
MVEPGDALSGEGMPNAFGDCAAPKAAHDATNSATTIVRGPKLRRLAAFEDRKMLDTAAKSYPAADTAERGPSPMRFSVSITRLRDLKSQQVVMPAAR